MSAPESFEEYVAARYAALSRTAYLLTGNHHDAEDLVQSVLMKAVPVWRRIRADPEPYVHRMLVNENISRWRKHRGREHAVASVPDEAATGSGIEDRLDLLDALRRLSPRQRTVLVLRYFEDLTEAQTAELMGTALGTVKSQARDALARLRTLAPGLDLRVGAEVPAGTRDVHARLDP
ncbi:MAG TPA: SigE family RNA polymerase sigma factor [Nocardioidaceae bacterium]|nr:SigE family RNA polymerase sigma factor [Nocardioidaceae bacterium]